jgi:hypothetical protein
MHRPDGGDRPHAGSGVPGQKFLRGAGIGPARVRVADVGGDLFYYAHRGALAGGGERRERRRANRDELVHGAGKSFKASFPLNKFRREAGNDVVDNLAADVVFSLITL